MDSSLSSCDNTGFQKHGNFQNYYYIALNKDTKWMCHAVQRKGNNSYNSEKHFSCSNTGSVRLKSENS